MSDTKNTFPEIDALIQQIEKTFPTISKKPSDSNPAVEILPSAEEVSAGKPTSVKLPPAKQIPTANPPVEELTTAIHPDAGESFFNLFKKLPDSLSSINKSIKEERLTPPAIKSAVDPEKIKPLGKLEATAIKWHLETERQRIYADIKEVLRRTREKAEKARNPNPQIPITNVPDDEALKQMARFKITGSADPTKMHENCAVEINNIVNKFKGSKEYKAYLKQLANQPAFNSAKSDVGSIPYNTITTAASKTPPR